MYQFSFGYKRKSRNCVSQRENVIEVCCLSFVKVPFLYLTGGIFQLFEKKNKKKNKTVFVDGKQQTECTHPSSCCFAYCKEQCKLFIFLFCMFSLLRNRSSNQLIAFLTLQDSILYLILDYCALIFNTLCMLQQFQGLRFESRIETHKRLSTYILMVTR